MGKALLSLAWHPEVTNPHRSGLMKAFRMGLVELSKKIGRPIEISTVNDEVWINIRDNTPISKDAIREFLELKPKMAVKPAKLTERIQAEWKW